jgi:hypothetical protein
MLTSGMPWRSRYWQKRQQLLAAAALRQEQCGVARREQTRVAVERVGRMQEHRGRAGARERRRELVGEQPRLADARHDHLATAVRDSSTAATNSGRVSLECGDRRGSCGMTSRASASTSGSRRSRGLAVRGAGPHLADFARSAFARALASLRGRTHSTS